MGKHNKTEPTELTGDDFDAQYAASRAAGRENGQPLQERVDEYVAMRRENAAAARQRDETTGSTIARFLGRRNR